MLLVEDSPSDLALLHFAFQESGLQVDLHVVRDGEEALRFMRRQAPFDAGPTPDLILLDLNLPRLGGFDVLEALKADDRLRDIPVVVLSTSDADADIRRAYLLEAESYQVKPVTYSELLTFITYIDRFWETREPHSNGTSGFPSSRKDSDA
ncbi:response regulator [Deinococcus hopiensis]|uniref:response regulator n=1 Tax=Deinococcus hopiensis TaxID=309885 RepID=UPI00148363E8|nr:response regulator [Deinococcus hopiensis]